MDPMPKLDRFGVEQPQNISREAMIGAFPGFEDREAAQKKKEADYTSAWGGMSMDQVKSIKERDIPLQVRALRGMEQGYLEDQKQLEFAKTELDGLAQTLQQQVAQNPALAQQAQQQYEAAVSDFNQMAQSLNKQGQDIRDRASYIEQQTKHATRREHELKAKQGGFWGATYNNALNSIGSAVSGISAPLFEAVSAIENPINTPESKADEQTRKKDLLDAIRNAPREMAGTEGTTEEYIQKMQEGFWGGAWLGATGSLPVAAMGPFGIGLMAQASDNVRQELEDPTFADIPTWEKEAFAMGVGGVVGWLERLGLTNAARNKGLVNGIVLKAVERMPQNATTQQIKAALRSETESYVANLGLRLVGGSLDESVTEFTQGIAEPGMKMIFNAIEEKNLTPNEDGEKGFDTPDGFSDFFAEAGYAGLQGMVGGAMYGAPRALMTAKKERKLSKLLSLDDYKPLEVILKDPEFANSVKEEHQRMVESGDMTQVQADEANASWEQSRSVVEKIPDDLDPEKRREAFLLLTEKEELSKLDKNLVGDRMAKIDEKLAALSGQPMPEGMTRPKDVNIAPSVSATGVSSIAATSSTVVSSPPSVGQDSGTSGSVVDKDLIVFAVYEATNPQTWRTAEQIDLDQADADIDFLRQRALRGKYKAGDIARTEFGGRLGTSTLTALEDSMGENPLSTLDAISAEIERLTNKKTQVQDAIQEQSPASVGPYPGGTEGAGRSESSEALGQREQGQEAAQAGVEEGLTKESLKEAFGYDDEVADATIAIADAMGLDKSKIKVVKGGESASDALFQEESAQWRSRLDDALKAKGSTMPASQWAKWMEARAKEGSLSMEEAKWTGISDWLASKGDERVTPQQVREFLKENRARVEVKELKGGSKYTADQISKTIERENGWIFYFGDVNSDAYSAHFVSNSQAFTEEEAVGLAVDEMNTDDDGGPSSKFSQYQLPGGSRYREVLVTLPSNAPVHPGHAEIERLLPEMQAARRAGDYDRANQIDARIMQIGRDIEAAGARNSTGQENLFRSSHFDEPNILVHLRLNDRVVDVPLTPQQEADIETRKRMETERDALIPAIRDAKRKMDAVYKPMEKQAHDDVMEMVRSGEITNMGVARNEIERRQSEVHDIETPESKAWNALQNQWSDINRRMPPEPKKRQEKILFIEELQSDFGQSLRKLEATIDQNFDDIVEKMKADGVLKKRCP